MKEGDETAVRVAFDWLCENGYEIFVERLKLLADNPPKWTPADMGAFIQRRLAK